MHMINTLDGLSRKSYSMETFQSNFVLVYVKPENQASNDVSFYGDHLPCVK